MELLPPFSGFFYRETVPNTVPNTAQSPGKRTKHRTIVTCVCRTASSVKCTHTCTSACRIVWTQRRRAGRGLRELHTDNAGCSHRWGGREGHARPHNAAPQGGCTCKARPRRDWMAARHDSGQRAPQNPGLHTCGALCRLPDAPRRLELYFSHKHDNGEPRHMSPQIRGTYISLLCINSMRSVKRTSRFRSQKPSAS